MITDKRCVYYFIISFLFFSFFFKKGGILIFIHLVNLFFYIILAPIDYIEQSLKVGFSRTLFVVLFSCFCAFLFMLLFLKESVFLYLFFSYSFFFLCLFVCLFFFYSFTCVKFEIKVYTGEALKRDFVQLYFWLNVFSFLFVFVFVLFCFVLF